MCSHDSAGFVVDFDSLLNFVLKPSVSPAGKLRHTPVVRRNVIQPHLVVLRKCSVQFERNFLFFNCSVKKLVELIVLQISAAAFTLTNWMIFWRALIIYSYF